MRLEMLVADFVDEVIPDLMSAGAADAATTVHHHSQAKSVRDR